MNTMSVSLSYTQDKYEGVMNNLFSAPNDQLTFVTNYGYGNTPSEYSMGNNNWKALKKELFEEYDDLWKELALH